MTGAHCTVLCYVYAFLLSEAIDPQTGDPYLEVCKLFLRYAVMTYRVSKKKTFFWVP